MLEIKTTNGDTLIHNDQQPDAMQITGYDGSRVMVHGGSWGNHKYIRKEGNRYIYPEDLQKAAKTVKTVYDDRGIYAQAAKNMVSDAKNSVKKYGTTKKMQIKDNIRKEAEDAAAANEKIKKKLAAKKKMSEVSDQLESIQDMNPRARTVKKLSKKAKAVYDDRGIYKDAAKNMASDYSKAAKDKWENGGKEKVKKAGKALLKSSKLGKLVDAGSDVSDATRSQVTAGSKKKSSLKWGNVSQVTKPIDRSMPSSEETNNRPKSRQKNVVDGGKEIKKGSSINKKKVNRKSVVQQETNAHLGYWENKKKFPDGGSTEELEIQKEKTTARKEKKKRRESM